MDGLPRGFEDGTSAIGVRGTLEILFGVGSNHNQWHKLRSLVARPSGPGEKPARFIVLMKPGNAGRGKGPCRGHAVGSGTRTAIAGMLPTPSKIRNLQKKLYLRAK